MKIDRLKELEKIAKQLENAPKQVKCFKCGKEIDVKKATIFVKNNIKKYLCPACSEEIENNKLKEEEILKQIEKFKKQEIDIQPAPYIPPTTPPIPYEPIPGTRDIPKKWIPYDEPYTIMVQGETSNYKVAKMESANGNIYKFQILGELYGKTNQSRETGN